MEAPCAKTAGAEAMRAAAETAIRVGFMNFPRG